MLIFNTNNYDKAAQDLTNKTNSSLGSIERKSFPDGEKYLRILSNTKNEDVIVLGGTGSDEEILELFDLCLTLSQLKTKSIKVFILYFGYSTMERSVKEGEVVRGLTRSYLLDSLPKEVQIFTLDIHSMKINNEFKNRIVKNLSSLSIIANVVNNLKVHNLVIASPDEGRSDFIIELADELNCPSAYVSKKRTSGDTIVLKEVFGEVKNKNVVIYDDMIRSGATLLNAAKAYKDLGAKSISVIATHGIFGMDVLTKLKESGLFASITISDSVPSVDKLTSSNFLNKFSIVPVVQKEIESFL